MQITETVYEQFPRIVEFAYKISHDEPVQSYVINQEGFIIPDDVIKIHGITNEIAAASTYKLKDIINRILAEGVGAKFVVGHNIYFETSIIKANTIRLCKEENIRATAYGDLEILLDKDKRIDTVRKGMAITKKWPKLHELYHALFGKDFNRHHAADDCQATYECYVELKKRGLA